VTENEHEEYEKRFMERKSGNLSMMMDCRLMGLLLGKKQRELKPVHQISFLTQRILLLGLYEGYDHDTVSKLAEYLDVSKMAINKSFDER